MDENPPLKSDAATEAEAMQKLGSGHLEAVIGMVEDADAPTPRERALIWDALFREYEQRAVTPAGERAAKRELCGILDQRLPGMLPGAASARSMNWRRQLSR